MHLLVIEDERALCETIVRSLRRLAYSVDYCYDGEKALELIAVEKYDLILLDLNLPGKDGMTVLRTLRQTDRETRVLILSARSEVEDKVQGLDIGADDYLTKPFATPELLARMRVVLRRQAAASGGEAGQASGEEVLSIKSLSMYIARHEVMVGNVPVELTKKEYDLLEYMLRNKRTVLSRDQILSNVWGYDYMGDTNVVDVYIRYLRQKLDDKFGEKYIHTMRGVGYVIKE